MSKKICGCDLGTGFSCVAVVEGGQPVVITNSEGKRTTPSAISFAKGEIKVGDPARRQAIMYPKETVTFIKRFMGEKYDDVKEEVERAQYTVVKGDNGMPRVDINGKLYSPEELSAMILQKMKKTAEDYLGEEVTDFVITCPAYYGDDARQAVKDAGKIAGMNVRRVINEPTAAALAYGIKEDAEQTIMVTDIGCGTSDFTVLEISSGLFETHATDGDTHLGGDDFDQVIIDWVVEKIKASDGLDVTQDPMAMQRIKEAAETAKIELSTATKTNINLSYIGAANGAPVHFNEDLTRTDFERMSDSLIKRIVEKLDSCVQKYINKTGNTKKDISEIIFVGGTTRIPAVAKAIEDYFGFKANKSVNPDEAVATGAAIQGAIIAGDNSMGDVVLLDVTPISLGIETATDFAKGIFTKIIEANTTIPFKKSETFSTAVDNQSSVEIKVYQGERPMVSGNKCLGTFHLDGILPAKKGVPQIEVTFDIDVNGILSVSAKDKATGKEQNIRIEGSSSLSDDEINRMKAEAEANAEADKKELEKIKTFNSADSMIYQTEKQIEEFKDKITDEQKTSLENGLTALKDAYEQKDVDACKSCMDILNKTWNDISEELYKGTATENPGGNGNPMDDIINNMGK